MKAKEVHNALFPLQTRDVDVQIHPIDAFDFQGDVIGKHFGNASWYAHFGSGTTPIFRDRLPLRRPTSSARAACGSPLSTGATFRIMPRPTTIRYTSSV